MFWSAGVNKSPPPTQTTWDKVFCTVNPSWVIYSCSPRDRNCKLDIYPRPMADSSTKITVEHVLVREHLTRTSVSVLSFTLEICLWPCHSLANGRVSPQRWTRQPDDQGRLAIGEHPADDLATGSDHSQRKGFRERPGGRGNPHIAPQTGARIFQSQPREPWRRASAQTPRRPLPLYCRQRATKQRFIRIVMLS